MKELFIKHLTEEESRLGLAEFEKQGGEEKTFQVWGVVLAKAHKENTQLNWQ